MSHPIPSRLLDALQAALGPSGLLTDAADVAPYLVDWRGAHGGAAPAVLRPSNTAEVAVAMKLCHGERVAVVPQGGNGLRGKQLGRWQRQRRVRKQHWQARMMSKV